MRTKLLLVLIVFFAGFCSAIYVTAPDPQHPQMRAEVMAQKVNVGMKQFLQTIEDKLTLLNDRYK